MGGGRHELGDPGSEHPRELGKSICYGLSCVPPRDVEVQASHLPVNLTLFRDRVFADAPVKMRSLGGALTQYD